MGIGVSVTEGVRGSEGLDGPVPLLIWFSLTNSAPHANPRAGWRFVGRTVDCAR
jgi:hypothetical protein